MARGDVINLDHVYDLRDTDEEGAPLDPGFRRDHLTGHVYYSSRWLSERATSVGELPGPDSTLVSEADRAAEGEPRDPEGAAIVAGQFATRPADGWIGPSRTMIGLVPTEDERVRHAASFFIDSLRAAQRCADRLAAVAGVGSPIRTNAEGASAGLGRVADRVERETL